jgi:hypothetical protein
MGGSSYSSCSKIISLCQSDLTKPFTLSYRTIIDLGVIEYMMMMMMMMMVIMMMVIMMM